MGIWQIFFQTKSIINLTKISGIFAVEGGGGTSMLTNRQTNLQSNIQSTTLYGPEHNKLRLVVFGTLVNCLMPLILTGGPISTFEFSKSSTFLELEICFLQWLNFLSSEQMDRGIPFIFM